MTSIALVEDNDDLRDMTRAYLTGLGYDVEGFEDAEDALSMAQPADIYIVDLNLPDMSGYDLIAGIRAVDANAGIVILSAREHVEDLVKGYDVGADIYLNKPCDPKILLASIKRLERRGDGPRQDPGTVLQVCSISLQAALENKKIQLSTGEVQLLRSLAMASQRGLERHEAATAFGINLENAKSKALDVRILRLRSKLEQLNLAYDLIITVRNFGFRITDKVALQFVT